MLYEFILELLKFTEIHPNLRTRFYSPFMKQVYFPGTGSTFDVSLTNFSRSSRFLQETFQSKAHFLCSNVSSNVLKLLLLYTNFLEKTLKLKL
jgi:hypothetical protein